MQTLANKIPKLYPKRLATFETLANNLDTQPLQGWHKKPAQKTPIKPTKKNFDQQDTQPLTKKIPNIWSTRWPTFGQQDDQHLADKIRNLCENISNYFNKKTNLGK